LNRLAAWLVAGLSISSHALAQPAFNQPAFSDSRTEFVALQSAPRFAPAQLLIKFPESTPASRIDRIAREMGGSLMEMVTPDGLAKVRLDPFADVWEARRRWSARSEVEYAAPNLIAHAFSVPNDTTIAEADLKWNLRQVGAFDAWDFVTADPRIVLAIVDSGVAFEDYPIPAYELPGVWPGATMYRQSPELPGPFVPGWDFVHDDAHPDDDYGHGTFVATIAAGAANNVAGSAGIAFGASILPVKVLDSQGDAEGDDIVKGIRFAADQGADIINLSLGYPPVSLLIFAGYTQEQIDAIFNPLGDAVRYAQHRGSLIVAAAGNFNAPEVSLPAAFPGVIAVGATNVDGSISSFSSYGKDLDFMAPGGDFTDLNGDHIQDAVAAMSIKPFRSAGSPANPDSFNVFFYFGTSMASPHVAGAAALLMSAGARDENTIERILRETATHPFATSQSWEPTYGWGLLQVDRAVRKVAGGRRIPQWRPLAVQGVDSHLLTPNPTSGTTEVEVRTSGPGRMTARVFDVRGALIRTISSGSIPAGSAIIRWDGRTDRGTPASAGVYFLRIETSLGRASHKVALLR
jgi:serine protease